MAARRDSPPAANLRSTSMRCGRLKRIGAPTLAPDGRLACAPVTSFDIRPQRRQHRAVAVPDRLRQRRCAGAKPRRLTAGDKDSDPRWSPDGSRIAFTAKRKDDDEAQIYLIAPDGGEATRLTNIATGAAAIKWFPDGKRIAFVSWVWPDLAHRSRAGEARHGEEGRQGQGAPDRARRIPLLGPLADRRPRAACVRVRHRDRTLRGPAAGHRASRCSHGIRRPSTTTSRPTAASSR